MVSKFFEFKEGGFLTKKLDKKLEKEKAFKLRYDIFHRELHWVDSREDEREIDDYDENATLLGVFNEEGELNGIARIISAQYPMMLEKEFLELVAPSHRIRKDKSTVEVTRFAVKKSMRKFRKRNVSLALYKAIYLWCLLNNVRYVYMVVDRRMMKNLKYSGFPCQDIGPVKKMKDGCKSMGAILDWREFERKTVSFPSTPSLNLNNAEFYSLCHGMAAAYSV